MIEYLLSLNQGSEALNSEPTLTANERPQDMTPAQLAREIHHMNPLIPEQTAKSIIDNLCEVICTSIAEGKRVLLMNGQDVYLSIYADVHLRQTMNLAALRARGFEGTAITEEAARYIQPSDLIVKAKAETEQKFTDHMRSHIDGLQRKGFTVKDYVRKKDTTTTPDTPTDPTNPGSGQGNVMD